MAFKTKRRVYESLPLSLKMCAGVVPFGWIAGRAYRATLARAKRFEWACREEILAYQEKVLGKMLLFATDHVPAYHGLRGIVERFSAFDAIKEFPTLNKDTLQKNPEKFLPRDFEKIPHYEISTGGTDGNQLKFYVDDVSQSVDMAFMHRQWLRVGYTPRCRKATFRGVSFPNLKHGVYWQYNPIYNELQFSPFHISEKTIASYVERLIAFQPEYLHGYPSAIDIFAEYIMRNSLQKRLPRIKAALLGSEGCLPEQRERIEKAFQTHCYSWYGHSERVVLAGECEKSSVYHHFPDYGILEIVAEDGSLCEREGERGEIIGTGLLNWSLPLIRYRTGDFATRCESRCECGRCWDRFTNVQGRWEQDMIIGQNGARISIAALNMHGPIFEKVRRYQYVQDEAGVCKLNLMVAPSFSDADRMDIEKAYLGKTGDELRWKVKTVSDIPLTSRGKLKLLCFSLKGYS
jgi:phenylacetate-CoA ligase